MSSEFAASVIVDCRFFLDGLFPLFLLVLEEILFETFRQHFFTNINQATSKSSQHVRRLAPIKRLNVPPTSQSKSIVPYPRSSRIYSYSRFWKIKLFSKHSFYAYSFYAPFIYAPYKVVWLCFFCCCWPSKSACGGGICFTSLLLFHSGGVKVMFTVVSFNKFWWDNIRTI